MMVLGYAICCITVLCMFFFCIPGNLVTFIVLYVIYIIGYRFFITSSGGARAIFTNDPIQRGKMGRWIAVFIALFYSAAGYYVSNVVVPAHGGIVTSALQQLAITFMIVAGIVLVIAIKAIKDYDVPERYRCINGKTVSFSDMFVTLKNNRNLQMAIVAFGSDKLCTQSASNSAVTMAVWGVVAGNYAFSGQLSMITLVPAILLMFYGTNIAMKLGNKMAVKRFSVLGILFAAAIILLFAFGGPENIGTSIPITALFLVLYCLYYGCQQVNTAVIRPMVADVTDSEMVRTGGKQLGAVINATFTFADKVISSLASTVVGFSFALIGYTTTLPQTGDPKTGPIVAVALFLWMGLPILGYICSLVAMKFYSLDIDSVSEIQKWISDNRKAE